MSGQTSCIQGNPGEYQVRCYFDILTFKVTMYLNIINPFLFFAWIVFVFVITSCKIDKIGMLMFFGTIIQLAVSLITSIIYLKQVLSNEILKLETFHYALLTIVPLIVNLKQSYFIYSLKKVRTWLESKTPLELK